MSTDLAADLLLLLYMVLVAAAAVQDMMRLRISNLFSVAVAAVCAIALVLDPGPMWWEPLLSFAIMLCLGIVLFSAGWMGGGDAKLMAGAAFAFSMIGLLRFVPMVLIIGGVVGLLAILLRPRLGSVPRRKTAVPYGVAIALGAIASVLLFRDLTVFAA